MCIYFQISRLPRNSSHQIPHDFFFLKYQIHASLQRYPPCVNIKNYHPVHSMNEVLREEA